MSPSLESVILDVHGKRIAGIRHRDSELDEHVPVLCIHGWLDNANSFVPLMPYLPAADLVAIDLPGHGYSDHLDAGYSINNMVFWCMATAAALGWTRFHLLGHSLGANISALTAAAAPEQIASLIMIESAGPSTEPAEAYPARLQRALSDRLQPEKFRSRRYASKDDAVDARLRAARMARPSARLIIDRQVRDKDGGWVWRFDSALRHASDLYLTEDHLRAALTSIACPTLTVFADMGYPLDRPETDARLACIPRHEHVSLRGDHHVHMDTPEPIGTLVNRFLGTRPALGG